MRVNQLVILAVLALAFLLYTSYHQQHRLSHALHADQNARDDHLFGPGSNANWRAVWAAARASGSEQEFITAMSASAHGGADDVGSSQHASSACPPQQECPSCPAAPVAAAAGTNTSAGGANAASWTSFLIDGQPPPISKELAHSVALDGAVIVTWANYALWDFVQSWVFHVKEVGLRNYLVGAMDAQIGRELVAAGVPCFAMYEVGANHSGVGTDNLQWGGEAFHKMGRQKITLAQLFLGLELDLLLVDVDVMLLGDVMEYFGRYPQADILVTSDNLATTLQPGDSGLERPEDAQAPMNIGLMFFRFSDRSIKFVNSWLDAINSDPKYWDQNAFNDLARQGWDPVAKVHPNQKRVFMGANGTLGVGVLPVASFSGGHTYYVQRLYEVQRVSPYAVHCTFQYGANPGKRNRLREAMLFMDPPEYYTEDSYVSVELRRVPSQTWAQHSSRNNSVMKRYHFRGLDMQLEAVWPGIRVAAITNRSIIVPKLACYCDKYWTELDKCRVPGARQTRVPFMCPMDHVLDPLFMDDGASGFKVRWREHSFLENPRCPEWVKHSRVTFYSGTTNTKPIEKWVVQEGGLVVLLPANLTEGAMKEALAPYSSYKVWHLKDPEVFFGGFDNKQLEIDVENRIKHLVPVMPPDPQPSPPPLANGTAAAPGSSVNTTEAAAGALINDAAASNTSLAATDADKDKSAGMLAAVHER